MSTSPRRTRAVALARGTVAAVVGLALFGAVGALALLSSWVPVPGALAAPALEVDVPAGRTDLVCPGSPRLLADEAVTFDPDFDPAAAEPVTTVLGTVVGRSGAASGPAELAATLTGEGAQALEPAGAPSASAALDDPGGASLLRAAPVGGASALVAGGTVARTVAGDLRGLASARCTLPAASGWLVAGSTELGNSARLVFANAGDTAATVRLEAWGAVGPIELGQAATVLVPAGSERDVLLEAFAPDEPRLALRYTVEGGQVAAFAQASSLTGFVPAGVDLSTPATEPATAVLVPGLVLEPSDIDTEHPAVLRILNPGSEPATVRLRLLHTGGDVSVPGAETRVVDPGTVSDVSLAGVPEGAYAAELLSDRPVTAAGVITRVGEPSKDDPDQVVVDRAWVPAEPLHTTAIVPLPGLGTTVQAASVVLSNPGEEPVDLVLRVVTAGGTLGASDGVRVPARSTLVVRGDRLEGALAVHVAVTEQDDEAGEAVSLDAAAEQRFAAAAVLGSRADDGPLVSVITAQPDVEAARAVAVRMPHR